MTISYHIDSQFIAKDDLKMSDYIIEVVQYTDPYCTWCWAAEPILRKIKEVYGDQIKITFKVGGLVKDIDDYNDPEIIDWIANHWLDASKKHGMPVDPTVWQDMKGEYRSTYPASIAYKAAQLQNPELANKYLRRLREAGAAEHRFIHRREVQIELAREIGLDVTKFVESLDNKSAEQAFYEDILECRSLGINAFPTFLIQNRQGKTVLVGGHRGFDTFEKIFKDLAGDEIGKRNLEATSKTILAFVKKYHKVARREVAEVFNLTDQKAEELLTVLESKEEILRQKAGNGYLWIYNE